MSCLQAAPRSFEKCNVVLLRSKCRTNKEFNLYLKPCVVNFTDTLNPQKLPSMHFLDVIFIHCRGESFKFGIVFRGCFSQFKNNDPLMTRCMDRTILPTDRLQH